MRIYEFNGIKISSEADTGFILYNITDTAETEFQEDPYIFKDGSAVSNFHYAMRTLCIEGNIWAESREEVTRLKREMLRRCNGKTKDKLFYTDNGERFFAYAVAEIPTFGRFEGNALPFTVNFTLYDFYWYLADAFCVFIADKTNFITSDNFALPMIFTSYTSRQTVCNEEDFSIYPTVKIKNTGAAKTDDIKVLNETTGVEVVITGVSLVENDLLTIDCQNLTAQNQSGENLLNFCNEFEDFCLASGDNVIFAESNDEDGEIRVAIEYFVPRVGV